MAKVIAFDLDNYGPNGMISLVRGDDWLLSGKVVDLEGPLVHDVDLSGVTGVSGFFPGPDGPIPGVVTITDTDCGKITLGLAASGSSGTQLSDSGVSVYITTEDPQGLHTIRSQDQLVQISDRSFQQV